MVVVVATLMPSDSTQLYRHYDEAGVLLYVGISWSAEERFREHRRGSRWASKIARMTVAYFPTRVAAAQAEAAAIRAERPLYNVSGGSYPRALYSSVGMKLKPVELDPQAMVRRADRLARNAARRESGTLNRALRLPLVIYLTDQRPQPRRSWRFWRR